MPVYKITVEYNGSSFSGWQSQPGQATVQGVLEEGLKTMLRHPVRIQGAGRTDAGVHAMGQVASFETSVHVDPLRLCRGLSALAGPHVAVVDAQVMPGPFNARFDSKGKHYRYQAQTGRVASPIHRDVSFFVPKGLDLAPMTEAAAHFVGEHDFAGFRAADCEREHTVRTMTRVSVSRGDHGLVFIDVEGTAFLKNMVRIMAGTLIDIGRGRLAPSTVKEVLESTDRQAAGQTAPARGLFLMEVFY